jgi:hypothetical protein
MTLVQARIPPSHRLQWPEALQTDRQLGERVFLERHSHHGPIHETFGRGLLCAVCGDFQHPQGFPGWDWWTNRRPRLNIGILSGETFADRTLRLEGVAAFLRHINENDAES